MVHDAPYVFCLAREAIPRGDDGRGFMGIFSVQYTQVLSFHECLYILKKQCFMSALLTVNIYHSVCMTQILSLELYLNKDKIKPGLGTKRTLGWYPYELRQHEVDRFPLNAWM